MTSPLLTFLGSIEQIWHQTYQNFTCPFEGHLKDLSLGLVDSFYKQVERPYIIDKSRGWSANISKLESICSDTPKLICTVRDIPSIIASFLRLFEKEPKGESNVDKILINQGIPISKAARCQVIWSHFVKGSWASFKNGYSHHRNCVHIVEYDTLLERPQEELQKIYQFLGLDSFEHNFEEITPHVIEDDEKWGIKDLHTIGSQLKRQSKSAESYLGAEIYKTYSDLKLEFWRAENKP